MKKNSIYLFLLISFFGCVKPVLLSNTYFRGQSRVGLYLVVNNIEHFKCRSYPGLGGLGVIINDVLALSNHSKYRKAFIEIDASLNPTEKIKNMYTQTFESKGKDIKNIDTLISDNKPLNTFEVPNSTKKYFNIDLRFIKEKYQLDELLVVNVTYGIYSEYVYGLESTRAGFTVIRPTLINLSDNSIMYNKRTYVKLPFEEEWEMPPAYENLKRGILASIDTAVVIEKSKYK